MPASTHATRAFAAMMLFCYSAMLLTACGGSGGSGKSSPTVIQISIQPSSGSVPKGASLQLTAMAMLSDHTTLDVTAIANWSSSSTAVSTVSNAAGSSGLVQALSIGSTTVSATYESRTASVLFTVTAAVPKSITITPAAQAIPKGVALQYAATAVFTDSTTQDVSQAVAWTSSNVAVATIAGTSGLAQSIATGTAIISGSYAQQSSSATLTVTEAQVAGVEITPGSASIVKGENQKFTAAAHFTDQTTLDVTASATWSSSNGSVATVSNASGSNGLAGSTGSGDATISAAYAGLSSTALLTVGIPPTAVWPYYIPFIQKPSMGATGSIAGLFVVRSDEPAAPPQQITSVPTSVYARLDQPINNVSQNLLGFEPFGLVYSTAGAATGDHIYALSLNATQAPTPKQLSTASFSSSNPLCAAVRLQTSLVRPDAAVLLYSTVGPDGVCATADDSVHLVHYTDSSTTLPVDIGLSAAALEYGHLFRLHNALGDVSAIFAVDADNRLVKYDDVTFLNPKVLLSEVDSANLEDADADAGYGLISVVSTSGTTSLYRVTDSGSISSSLYDAGAGAIGSGGPKDGFYYFAAAVPASAEFSYSIHVARVPLDGSSAAQVLATTVESTGASWPPSMAVEGFIGTSIIVSLRGGSTASIYGMDLSVLPSPMSSILRTGYGGLRQVVVINDRIFATLEQYGLELSGTYIIDAIGTQLDIPYAKIIVGVDYQVSGQISPVYSPKYTPTALYLQGISSLGPYEGGGVLERLALDTLSTTPVLDAISKQSYQFSLAEGPAGIYLLGRSVIGFQDNVQSESVNANRDAMVIDATSNLIYRITNTPDIDEISY